MAQTIYPVVTKTISQTKVLFNFIQKVDGKLVETETQERIVSSRTNKNKQQLALQKEFPDETIQVLSVKTEKVRFTMSAEQFMQLADKEIVDDSKDETATK